LSGVLILREGSVIDEKLITYGDYFEYIGNSNLDSLQSAKTAVEISRPALVSFNTNSPLRVTPVKPCIREVSAVHRVREEAFTA
jgi:hypothetical protein